MIIAALYDYYKRLAADEKSDIPRQYYSKRKVSYALNLSRDGKLLDVIDLRVEKDKKLTYIELDGPEEVGRTVKITPNFLCDNSKYVFGVDSKGYSKRTQQCFEAFRKHNAEILEGVDDDGARAVVRFLKEFEPDKIDEYPVLVSRLEDITEGSNIVFRLDGDDGFIHERPAIKKAWEEYCIKGQSDVLAQCLVTGEVAPIARLHGSIKGVRGANTSGASLVSFNIDSATSYGKEQSYNAPTSESVVFGYVTVLNYLLSSGRQRVQLGDTTTVFWAERSGPEENLMVELFAELTDTGGKRADESVVYDAHTTQLLHDVLTRARDGRPIKDSALHVDPDVRFYILGLSPNKARIAVRYWHVDTFGSLVERIGMHYQDMDIVRPGYISEDASISVNAILRELAPLGDSRNIPPIMGGAVMRSILTGLPYPRGLYSGTLSRIRADQNVNYVRAAVLKACLVRNARIQGNKTIKEVVTVGLNEQTENIPYRLGRLFALLEKAQQDATPGLNATIKDRYFGSASATPRAVFPILMRLAQHHVAKSEYGHFVDKRIEEVLSGIQYFPAHLTLEEQGLFVLGYYHQRQALYEKNERKEG